MTTYIIVNTDDGLIVSESADLGQMQTVRDELNADSLARPYAVITRAQAEPTKLSILGGEYVSFAGLAAAKANRCDASCPYCGSAPGYDDADAPAPPTTAEMVDNADRLVTEVNEAVKAMVARVRELDAVEYGTPGFEAAHADTLEFMGAARALKIAGQGLGI